MKQQRLPRRSLGGGSRRAGIATLALIPMLLLSACTGGGTGGSGNGGGKIDAPTGTSILTEAPGGTPKDGGTLTVAFVGGGAAETLDPNAYGAAIDNARGMNLFDRLTRVNPDLKVENELAESFTPNSDYTQWTLKLRDGVKFHDGSPLTVDDVLFTLGRITGEASSNPGKPMVESVIDFANTTRTDDLTLTFNLKRAFVPFPDMFSDYWMVILKNGTTDFSNPIGTGPFMYKEFSPGNGSKFVKNPDYWREGEPHVDELAFVSIPNPDSRLSALKSGQVDAVEQISFTQARANANAPDMRILEGKGPVMTPFIMDVTQKPFDDVRVRQAMKLLVDRQKMVDSVQAGFGEIGNDLYGKGLQYYNEDLPQRTRDIEEAKRLLKEAGQENLTVSLSTGTNWPGQLESAQILVQQAAEAGVTIKLDVQPADQYFANAYGKVPFFQSNWQAQPIATWLQTAMVAGGLFNETKWDVPAFTQKIYDAQAEPDAEKAQALYNELQEQLHNEGGMIIWGFFPYLDGISPQVHGAKGNGWVQLSAATYREWWIEK